MSEIDIWKKYSEKKIIGKGNYSIVYKAKNNKTGKYVAIKEINNQKYKINIKQLKEEIDEIQKINLDNIVKIEEIIELKNKLYIIMDLCSIDLNNYLLSRDKPLSINELKEILFQLNNIFKKLNEVNQMNIINIEISNILLNLNEINKISIKLSYLNLNKFTEESEITANLAKKIFLTTPPEILKGESYNNKNDIWSLGIIIYYMLNKKYPYEGKNEIKLYQNIISNQNIELNKDEELNNLLKRMLKVNINERISWEDYFNHSFFKQQLFPKFNFICKTHLEQLNYYCINCKINICDSCFNQHILHQIIPFSQIGFNNLELNQIQNLLNNIENNINKLIKMKENIKSFINKIKLCKTNCDIYEKNLKNNFKEYYINCLNIINEKSKIEENINIINLKENYIICEYDIKKEELNKPIQILNCLDEDFKKILEERFKKIGIDDYKLEINDNEINNMNCELFLNNKKIDFCLKYIFKKEGKYNLKILFKKLLKNTSFIFNGCSSLNSLNLSNFNTNNVNNMSYMFGEINENCKIITKDKNLLKELKK